MLYSRGANKQLGYRTHRGLTYLTRTEKKVLSPSSSIARKRFWSTSATSQIFE